MAPQRRAGPQEPRSSIRLSSSSWRQVASGAASRSSRRPAATRPIVTATGAQVLFGSLSGDPMLDMLIGALFTVLGLWGLLVTDQGSGSLLDTIPVGTEDNLLHLAVGLTAIAAGFAGSGGAGRPPAPA